MRQLFNNKKGSDAEAFVAAEKPFKHIAFIIIISGVMIAFLVYGTNYMDAAAHVDENMEAELIMQRLQNVCFASTDPATGKTMENVIDYNKVNRDVMDSCFSGGSVPPMLIMLKPLDVPGHNDFNQKVIKHGKGKTEQEYVRYSLVKKGGNTYPAELHVKV